MKWTADLQGVRPEVAQLPHMPPADQQPHQAVHLRTDTPENTNKNPPEMENHLAVRKAGSKNHGTTVLSVFGISNIE